MGVVEAKLSVKADEPSSSSSFSPPAPPPTDCVDTVNGVLIALKLAEENPADGVGTPGLDGPDDDAGPDEDLESLKKVGEEAAEEEEGVGPRFPNRPDEPDCAFYMKTGTCKFGLNCKFNHPLQKRRLRTAWARLRKQSADVQAAKDEHERSGSKMIGQTTHKHVVEKKKETPFKRMEQTEKKSAEEVKQAPSRRMEQKGHKNVVEKTKDTPLKKVEQTEKKEEKQNSSLRMEQEAPNVKLKKKWKAVQVDEKEKEIANNAVQAESEVVKDKQSPPQRMKQEDNKGVKEKQILSDRMQLQDNKAAKKTGRETTAEKVGVTECKYHTMPGGCKYGKSCKYVHSQKKKEVDPVELNFLGLPIRPGEKECLIYMRTGNCKHAANCKYHHPDPTVATVQHDPLSGCQSSQLMQQIGFGASPLPMMPNPTEGPFHGPTSFMVAPPSYSPGSNLHPQGRR